MLRFNFASVTKCHSLIIFNKIFSSVTDVSYIFCSKAPLKLVMHFYSIRKLSFRQRCYFMGTKYVARLTVPGLVVNLLNSANHGVCFGSVFLSSKRCLIFCRQKMRFIFIIDIFFDVFLSHLPINNWLASLGIHYFAFTISLVKILWRMPSRVSGMLETRAKPFVY